MMWPWRRGAAERAEMFRKGHEAGEAMCKAQLAGIVNLHRPGLTIKGLGNVALCRTCSRPHPCPTYKLAGGPNT
jgi:hypothetical protein